MTHPVSFDLELLFGWELTVLICFGCKVLTR